MNFFHKLLGHKKLTRFMRLELLGEARGAGWQRVSDMSVYYKPGLNGPEKGVDMWRWIDKAGDFIL